MTVAALIVAAGKGVRMGAPRPKVFLPLEGEAILARAVAPFLNHPHISQIVVVAADAEAAREVLDVASPRVSLVPGGPERQDSVRLGLQAIDGVDIVLIHDAARPMVTASILDAVIEAAAEHGAAVPVLPVGDTVKRLSADRFVVSTVPRQDLALAQTPQGFRAEVLLRAYAQAARDGFRGTDDASVVEHYGGRVVAVEGSSRNIKVTVPGDLAIAAALLRFGGAQEVDGDG
jgi:2-C-methyl-D-erythritol 4-phosphate cytidylyltransferase